jgi:hypothetical protein
LEAEHRRSSGPRGGSEVKRKRGYVTLEEWVGGFYAVLKNQDAWWGVKGAAEWRTNLSRTHLFRRHVKIVHEYHTLETHRRT